MFRHEYADDADDADDELPPLEYDDNEYTSPQHIPLPSSPDNDRAPRIDGAPPTLRRKTSFERVEEFIDSLGRDSTPAASHERRSTSDSYDQLPPLPRTRYWARRVVIDDEDEDATIEQGFQNEERGVETPKQRRAKTSERIREMRGRQEAAVPIASRSTAFARFFPQLPNTRFGTGQRQSLPSRSAIAAPAIPSYYNSSTHQRIDRKKEEIDRMEDLLLPVCVNLSLLQNTRIPPYNPHIKAKSTPEVLKAKVLPIGKHILNVLKKEPEEKRGASELDICRYVADRYWPQSVMRADGLRIMEMYRNALFREELETARLDAWNDASWEEEEVEEDGDQGVGDKHEDQREIQANRVVLGGAVVDLGEEEVKGG